jgi:DNA recombination protein RmuC
MSVAVLLALLAGLLLGGMAVMLWRVRREQSLRVELELLRARIKDQAVLGAEREQTEVQSRQELKAAFGELARDSLQSNSEFFMQLAREKFAQQQTDAWQTLKERETAIESLVRPIREALAKTEVQIQTIERQRIDSFAGIKTQMELLASGQDLLSRETRNLVSALRRPDVRGRWGEITLRRLVELSGMTLHVDFSEQLQVATDTGSVRPDMVVHMPEQRDIVVDVKTPLDAYLAAIEAQDEEGRGSQLRRHAQIVGARVRELASKQYWSQFERSPDFVVLFLPGDQFLSAALQDNPTLIDDSMRQKVMLATPTSLVALLKVIEHGWKQSALAENAAEVRRLGQEIHKRLAVFAEHLAKLGKSLAGSVDHYNRAVGSLEQQVLPAARRFPDLGLPVARDIEPLDPIAALPRSPRQALENDGTDERDPENP